MPRLTADELVDRHPATTGLLRWFEYEHLPEHLQAVSRPCAELAHEMVRGLPDDPELSAGLRDLLKAKDAFVRAAIGTTITRDRGPWVAPNAREAVNGTDLERERRGPGFDEAPRCSFVRDGEQCIIGDRGAGHVGDHLFPSEAPGWDA